MCRVCFASFLSVIVIVMDLKTYRERWIENVSINSIDTVLQKISRYVIRCLNYRNNRIILWWSYPVPPLFYHCMIPVFIKWYDGLWWFSHHDQHESCHRHHEPCFVKIAEVSFIPIYDTVPRYLGDIRNNKEKGAQMINSHLMQMRNMIIFCSDSSVNLYDMSNVIKIFRILSDKIYPSYHTRKKIIFWDRYGQGCNLLHHH